MQVTTNAHIGYTVPQRFRADSDGVEFYFRVRRVFKESRIQVTCGDQVIASFKREHMAPGEMETIKIPKALLARIDGDTLHIAKRRYRHEGFDLHYVPQGPPLKGG